ncbi:hypothetical protein COO60DRAFT_1554717 [Scenedesmus sp. NREL 46B-D3]|nr:hypothetical protein COO60DRAFT_1554717 [Scenedesmus sp. NREL 46B-D3]
MINWSVSLSITFAILLLCSLLAAGVGRKRTVAGVPGWWAGQKAKRAEFHGRAFPVASLTNDLGHAFNAWSMVEKVQRPTRQQATAKLNIEP